MKRIILLCSLLIALNADISAGKSTDYKESESLITLNPAQPREAARVPKIQLAILLDTSGSMHGLIEQAKSRLWNIVNTLTSLHFQGKAPDIEIALYEYGSYSRYNGDYIRQITPLTTDLDQISQELFALTTGGSEEFCGTVISRATKELEWGRESADMKLIYIAGNEIFEQGRISYKTAIPNAVKENIFVNTIHCGNRHTGIRDLWQDAAVRGKGKFFNIDANAAVRHIETPFDDRISHLNMQLNDTYIGYGMQGENRKNNQSVQDKNAKSISSANYAERVVSKSKAAYKNSSWDLVDKIIEDKDALAKINKKDLPVELQNKSTAELKVYVDNKQKERENLQKEISDLASKRQNYIDDQIRKENKSSGDDLGNAITESILSFANIKGYTVK